MEVYRQAKTLRRRVYKLTELLPPDLDDLRKQAELVTERINGYVGYLRKRLAEPTS
jgi:hypothetical protein